MKTVKKGRVKIREDEFYYKPHTYLHPGVFHKKIDFQVLKRINMIAIVVSAQRVVHGHACVLTSSPTCSASFSPREP